MFRQWRQPFRGPAVQYLFYDRRAPVIVKIHRSRNGGASILFALIMIMLYVVYSVAVRSSVAAHGAPLYNELCALAHVRSTHTHTFIIMFGCCWSSRQTQRVIFRTLFDTRCVMGPTTTGIACSLTLILVRTRHTRGGYTKLY